jgi:hypothetical protein
MDAIAAGLDALQRGTWAEASAQFSQALKEHANDVDPSALV